MKITHSIDIDSGAIVPRTPTTAQPNGFGKSVLGLCRIICSLAKIDFLGVRLVHVQIGGEKNNPGVNIARINTLSKTI
jgi:hypothetical protein